MNAREQEKAVTVDVYPQLDLEPIDAKGVHIHTRDGRTILDMYGGHAVAALGYGHPALQQALADQANGMVFQSNAVPLAGRARAASALLDFGPENMARVFFCNSGGEANENALRIACMLTGRRRIVALEHGFHGRTAAAAAVTWGSKKRWYGFPQTPFDVSFVPRDDLDAARTAISDDVAAVIVEPVQGVAGAYDLAPEFIRGLAAAARKHGALFIADEVQSGIGRTGYPFAVQRLGVEADLITAAKSLGGGFPCAAVLTTASIAGELRHGDLGTTFGGGPLAARAIETVIQTIQEEGLMANVLERERQIKERCVVGPVQRISGLGFLCGLHVKGTATAVRNALLDLDILTGTSADPAVVRLLPPLTLGEEHIDQLANALARITT